MNWISCSDLRREARKSLSGRWGLAVGVFLIGMIITAAPSIIVSGINRNLEMMGINQMIFISSIITIAFSIIMALVEIIFEYGYCNFSLNIAEDKNAELKNIFSGFKHTPKLLLLWLIKGIAFSILLIPLYVFLVAGAMYFFIALDPSIMVDKFVLEMLNGEFISGLLFLIFIVFMVSIITVTVYVILDALISQTNYILKENNSESMITCIKSSFKMMKGHVWNYIILNLSFIGWAILCGLFTFGIGLLWLIPYVQITRTKFYIKIKEQYYLNKMSINY